MKTNLFLTAILLSLTQLIYAQSNKRQYVGLSLGPSITLADFVKTDLSDSTSGFAKTGLAFNFTYAYRLNHNFGVMALGNYSSNKLNNAAYAEGLQKANPEYLVAIESSQNWANGGLFAGPFFRFPIGDYFSLDVRGLIGYFVSYSPEATIYATEVDPPKETFTYYNESARASGFGYVLGAGLKYRLNNYYITAFADYIGSDLHFSNATGWDWNDEPFTESFNQKINYLTVTVGVAYIL